MRRSGTDAGVGVTIFAHGELVPTAWAKTPFGSSQQAQRLFIATKAPRRSRPLPAS